MKTFHTKLTDYLNKQTKIKYIMQNRKNILLLSGVLFLLPRPNDSLLFLLLFPHFKMFEFLMMMQWVDFLIFLAENIFYSWLQGPCFRLKVPENKLNRQA